MHLNLKLKYPTDIEQIRQLLLLAKARQTATTTINVEFELGAATAIVLLEDEALWQPASVPNALVPRLCKVLKAVEQQESVQAIADLKDILGVQQAETAE